MENKLKKLMEKLQTAISGNQSSISLSVDEMAALLRTSPEALEEFEKAYREKSKDFISENYFEMNSRQAAVLAKEHESDGEPLPEDLINRIVKEILSEACVYHYDGKNHASAGGYLPEVIASVTNEEISALPMEVRPQLTGDLAKVDLNGDTASALLSEWNMFQRELQNGNMEKAKMFYHHFRQGLDILDLDPITWKMLDQNPNSMGHWLPALVEAVNGPDTVFRIPATSVVKVPLTLLQLTRIDYESLTRTSKEIANRFCDVVFDLDDNKTYFIKTGTYSSKFDFRNAKVTSAEEVHDIGEYLLFIQNQAVLMASPLTQPSIYGVSTTTEWVCREYVEAEKGTLEMYNGLPIRPEFRVFVDCDTDEVLGVANYWDSEVMKKRFAEHRNGYDIHDEITFRAASLDLEQFFQKKKDWLSGEIAKLLPSLQLNGQWSLDIMYNKKDDSWYLIDMAIAEQSAYYADAVPIEKRRRTPENWIPDLSKQEQPFAISEMKK